MFKDLKEGLIYPISQKEKEWIRWNFEELNNGELKRIFQVVESNCGRGDWLECEEKWDLNIVWS